MAGLVILRRRSPLMALLAPLLADRDGLRAVNAVDNPTWARRAREFPFGTDNLGRSVAAQFVWGARISLFVGLTATIADRSSSARSSASSPASSAAGPSAFLMRITDWFLVIPFLPLAIVLAAVLGRSVLEHHLRHRRSRRGRHRRDSCGRRCSRSRSGCTSTGRGRSAPARWHVIRRHVLPNVAPLILANTTLAVPIAILTETTLAFLGLGDPTAAVVGQDARGGVQRPARSRRDAWWYYLPAGLGIVARRARVHDVRAGAGGDPRPAAAGAAMSDATPSVASDVDEQPARAARPARDVPDRRRRRARGARRRPVDRRRRHASGWPGESGCGKSTLASAVLRLLPTRRSVEGEVLLDGEDVYAMKPGRLRAVRWTQAAIVFQGALHSLNPVQRVGRQIAEAIELHDADRRPAHASRGRRAARAGRAPGRARRRVPAPALGRAAPAGADRHGAGVRARSS